MNDHRAVPTRTASSYDLPLMQWLLALFLLASPFYVFAVVSDRDWPALWVLAILTLVWCLEVFRRDGAFWFDRSFVYLLFFFLAYVVSATSVLLSDNPMSLMGRDSQERAVMTIVRLLYVLVAYFIFVNVLAFQSHRSYKSIFMIHMVVGLLVAVFGIVQYISNVMFGWSGLVHIAPTNESFKLYSSYFGHGSERFYRAAAFFSEPSAFGFFLVPFFVKAVVARANNVIIGNKLIHAGMISVFLVAILFNLSMTAIMSAAMLIGLFGLYSLRRSRHFWKFVALSVFAVALVLLTPAGSLALERLDRVFGLQDVSTLDRLFRVVVGFEVFTDHPFFGIGPGGFAFLYPHYGGFAVGGLASPLNVWITFLTDVGIIGLIPFLVFVGNVIARGFRQQGADPLVSVYLWGVISLLILLTTLDGWYFEMFWFEAAMVVTLASRTNALRGALVRA